MYNSIFFSIETFWYVIYDLQYLNKYKYKYIYIYNYLYLFIYLVYRILKIFFSIWDSVIDIW